MRGTPRRRWSRLGNAAVLAAVCVLGVATTAIPAQASEGSSPSGGVVVADGPLLPGGDSALGASANTVNVLTGARVGDAGAAVVGFHPMLLVVGGVLVGFAIAILVVVMLPTTRRKSRPTGLFVAGVQRRPVGLQVRAHQTGFRHARS